MNYMEIKYNNIANGPGIRTSLFVSGCSHACKGCFNYEAWNRNGGKPYTTAVQMEILDSLNKEWVDGLTLLGGEPMMDYNVDTLIDLCKEVRKLYPNKTIWVFSGWTFDELIDMPKQKELLQLCDVLIDGKWDADLYSPRLNFRGSSNQRIIDLKATFELGEFTIYGKAVVVLDKHHNEI